MYFSATAFAGKLLIDGISDRGAWDAGRISLQGEHVVSILNGRLGYRRVDTVEALREILAESGGGLPSIRLWIRSDLIS